MSGEAPIRVGDILETSFERLGVKKRLTEYQILKLWERLVGTDIAKRAQPFRLMGGRLYVRVSSAPWMSELTHQKINIIKKINTRLSKDVIEDIIFQVGRLKGDGH